MTAIENAGLENDGSHISWFDKNYRTGRTEVGHENENETNSSGAWVCLAFASIILQLLRAPRFFFWRLCWGGGGLEKEAVVVVAVVHGSPLTICGDACPLSCVNAEACLTGWSSA